MPERKKLASLEDPLRRDQLRKRLSAFTPDATRRWGTMTAGGAMCHVALCFELVTAGGMHSRRSGLLGRTMVRYFALHTPVPWPRGVPTLPELVEGEPGVRSQGFDIDHRRLLTAFDRFVRAQTIAGLAHPIFGPLTHWEWMRWGYLHADHHLRQFGL
jgi:hypothetical protein